MPANNLVEELRVWEYEEERVVTITLIQAVYERLTSEILKEMDEEVQIAIPKPKLKLKPKQKKPMTFEHDLNKCMCTKKYVCLLHSENISKHT